MMAIGGLAILGMIKAIPWTTIIRVGALVAIVLAPVAAAAWFGYQYGYGRGVDELLEQAAEYEEKVRARNEVLEGVREDLEENRRRLEAAQLLYDELEARPPRIIVRYRDAAPAPADVIVSPEAEVAIAELLDFMRQLAALEVEP
jgi:hypothetical protein